MSCGLVWISDYVWFGIIFPSLPPPLVTPRPFRRILGIGAAPLLEDGKEGCSLSALSAKSLGSLLEALFLCRQAFSLPFCLPVQPECEPAD